MVQRKKISEALKRIWIKSSNVRKLREHGLSPQGNPLNKKTKKKIRHELRKQTEVVSFRVDEGTYEQLDEYLMHHPEYKSYSHLIKCILKEKIGDLH